MVRELNFRNSLLALLVLTLAVAVPLPSRAQEPESFMGSPAWAPLHLTEPTEIPGDVLQPGDYVTRLDRDAQGRTVVQILSPDETKLYATLLTVVTEQLGTAPKGEFTFYPTDNSQVRHALHAWVIPGSAFGQEFVYPESRVRAFQMAMAAAPTATVAQEPTTTAQVEPAMSEPETTRVASAEPMFKLQPMPIESAAAPRPMPKTLPRSGSSTPTLFLIGLALLLLGSAGFKLAWARSHSS